MTDASPTGGGGATSSEFKGEPQQTQHDGAACHQCGGTFDLDGRFPCPAGCGVALCGLSCIWRHRAGSCRRKAYQCPRFGERFAGKGVLSKEVARIGGIEVQEPFDLEYGHDFFSPAGKAALQALEEDEGLRAEHWGPDSRYFSKARGRSVRLRDGHSVRGPQAVRDLSHTMGLPWLNGDMKAKLRKTNAMAMKSLKRLSREGHTPQC